MKRILLTLATALLAFNAGADEGMWLLPLLQKMNINTMQEMGCKLSADDIYSVNHSSLKDAVVMFGGGCTGEIISGEGLLVTNHHCGYSSIQSLSSVEHDYLTDGYWAMSRSEELPVPGLSVTFLESFTDVTKDIEKAVSKAVDEEDADILRKTEMDRLCEKAKGGKDYLGARVYSMYSGNSYYLVVTKTYTDVRFVGAPPSAIGRFGSETDNWMWPRHTCDFSMFRVYADKHNNPAAYSADNVPYRARKFLPISTKGVEEGDFSFIMGYPGTTHRFMTRSEVEETILTNSISIEARTLRQEIMLEDMLSDPAINIQYASKFQGSSNGCKKYRGMNETFEKLSVPERRGEQEASFSQWISKNRKRSAQYEGTLDLIDSAVEGRREAIEVFDWLAETVARAEIPTAANAVLRSSPENVESALDRFYKNYSASTDRKIIKAMMKLYREKVSPEDLISVYRDIDAYFGGDIDAYVDNMFDNSIFTDRDRAVEFAKEYLSDKDNADLAARMEGDPATVLLHSINDALPPLRAAVNRDNAQLEQGRKAYTRAQLEMGGDRPIYPDANSTMRLTYGQVLSYSPKDAVLYRHYTTLDGVIEKDDPESWEFAVPGKLKDLWKAKDFGRWSLPDGRMPACFLTNCDITGGNSGSPVLNAEGQLIGLAFDGNWEAMSGDIIFEPNLQRCICVDIRYVLFIIEKFGGAGYLLDEMKLVTK